MTGYRAKYEPRYLERLILEETLVRHPEHPRAKEIIAALIGDPDDSREVETATKAIANLKRSGLLHDRDDEIAEPTEVVVRVGRLLMGDDFTPVDSSALP
jgi:hypothetical protein